MKRLWPMIKVVAGILIAVFIATIPIGCGGKPGGDGGKSSEAVHLKAVCFLPKNHAMAAMVPAFVDKVKEKSNGEVIIEYLGGPEVIPTNELFEAVRRGKSIDIAFTASSHYQSVVPEGLALHLSRITPWEERQTGFYQMMVDAHKKAGVMYLGRWLYSPFYLWAKKEIKKPEELQGMKMRTLAMSDRFMKSLGIVPVTIQPADTYVALERGMVEGFAWGILGPRSDGWTENVKYLINHPFYDMQNCSILMNLDKWNTLTPKHQQMIQEAAAEFERAVHEHFRKAIDDELKILKEKEGVKLVEFSPADAKRYVDTAYDVEWKAMEEKCPPDVVAKLKELCSKK